MFNDSSIEVLVSGLAESPFKNLQAFKLGVSRCHVTDLGLAKICPIVKSLHARDVFLGVSGNKLTKVSVPVLTDIASSIDAEKFQLGCILIAEWDKNDYDAVKSALETNPSLKVHLLNNMRV